MSCGYPTPGCLPQANFPRPTDRRAGGRPEPTNATIANGRIHRRRTYFSPGLHRASAVLQNPLSIRFRELCLLVFLLLALYKGALPARRIYGMVAIDPVDTLCRRLSLAGCGYRILWLALWSLWRWAGDVVPWAFVCAVVIFGGEEVLASFRRKSSK